MKSIQVQCVLVLGLVAFMRGDPIAVAETFEKTGEISQIDRDESNELKKQVYIFQNKALDTQEIEWISLKFTIKPCRKSNSFLMFRNECCHHKLGLPSPVIILHWRSPTSVCDVTLRRCCCCISVTLKVSRHFVSVVYTLLRPWCNIPKLEIYKTWPYIKLLRASASKHTNITKLAW